MFSTADSKSEGLITWSDLWILLIAQALLIGIYTRLWVKDTASLGRLLLPSHLSEIVEAIITFFDQHHRSSLLFFFALFALGTMCGLLNKFDWFKKSSQKKLVNHLIHASLILSLIIATLIFIPHVAQNLVRYWTYTQSLAHEMPDDLGIRKPPAFGYAELLFRHLPEFPLFASLISLALLVSLLISRKASISRNYILLWTCALIAVLLWVIPVSLPKKKVLRYILPIYPFLYLFIAAGIYHLVSKLLFCMKNHGSYSRLLISLICTVIFALAASVLWSSSPH